MMDWPTSLAVRTMCSTYMYIHTYKQTEVHKVIHTLVSVCTCLLSWMPFSSNTVHIHCTTRISGGKSTKLGLVPRPLPFYLPFVFTIILHKSRTLAKNREGLGPFMTWMMSGGREVDVRWTWGGREVDLRCTWGGRGPSAKTKHYTCRSSIRTLLDSRP